MHCFTHHDYTLSLPSLHRFPMQRYQAIYDVLLSRLDADPSIPLSIHSSPRLASIEEVQAVHDEKYVSDFIHGTLDAKSIRKIGFPWSEDFVRRTFRITGATLEATERILSFPTRKSGCIVSANLAGYVLIFFQIRFFSYKHGEGFCVFNDIAVAAHFALHEADRVLVIDLDVHQGNGTADILKTMFVLFFLNFFLNFFFALQKLDSLVNEDRKNIKNKTLTLNKSENPNPNPKHEIELIIYQAGVDPLKEDRLGKLSLSHKDLQKRNQIVYDWVKHRREKLQIDSRLLILMYVLFYFFTEKKKSNFFFRTKF
eukprot:GSMAST32.ASY1.ANO1.222.1 assembled CDS